VERGGPLYLAGKQMLKAKVYEKISRTIPVSAFSLFRDIGWPAVYPP
jgi:hypothetical protein